MARNVRCVSNRMKRAGHRTGAASRPSRAAASPRPEQDWHIGGPDICPVPLFCLELSAFRFVSSPALVSPFSDILISAFCSLIWTRRTMKLLRARWIKAGAVSALILGMASAASAAPATTVDARDLLLRLQRLERDMRDLQAETFRQNP